MHAFLDVPADLVDTALGFWAAATGSTVGAPWPEHPEFRSLEPPTGTRYLHVQRHGGEPRAHLDLETPDVDAETARLVGLGATAGDRHRWWQTLTSPGGLPFCLVEPDAPRVRPGSVRWPGGHRSRVAQLALDIPAPVHDAECAFWAAATGWAERAGRRPELRWLDPPVGSPLQLLLHRLGTDDTGTAVRAHLDLGTDAVDAEVRRLVGLGATATAGPAEHGGRWVALRDPTGLPFCVTPLPPDRRAAG